jgi:hypothetical protein
MSIFNTVPVQFMQFRLKQEKTNYRRAKTKMEKTTEKPYVQCNRSLSSVHIKHVAGPNHFKGIWIQQFEKFRYNFRGWEWRIPNKRYVYDYLIILQHFEPSPTVSKQMFFSRTKKGKREHSLIFYSDLFLKLIVYFEHLNPVVDSQSECKSGSPSQETQFNAIWCQIDTDSPRLGDI